MIEVRLFATLAPRSRQGKRRFEVEPAPGLTVRDVVHREGLAPADIQIVMRNGSHAKMDSELEDGDRIGLFPPVGGG